MSIVMFDPTDPQNYPSPDCKDMLRWIWEFMRRNEDYVKDYDLLKALPLKTKEDIVVWSRWYDQMSNKYKLYLLVSYSVNR